MFTRIQIRSCLAIDSFFHHPWSVLSLWRIEQSVLFPWFKWINISFSCFPVGGKFKSYWPNFLTDVSIIVYVIDSSASQRFDESKDALLGVLSDDTQGVPLLLLACKQDAEGAQPLQDVASFFGLQELSSSRKAQIAAVEILDNGETHGVQEAKELILNFCTQK